MHPRLPRPLRGFEHVTRYPDEKTGQVTAKILPGEYYVTIQSEAITTLLGSCVAACIRDPASGAGGMNHIMLPESPESNASWHGAPELSAATRYGNVAMERLLNELLKRGARREQIEVKVFGGASLGSSGSNIGQRNVDFVLQFLEREGLRTIAHDLGGNRPRRVLYFPETGRALLQKLSEIDLPSVRNAEETYSRQLASEPVSGEIELFT